MVYANKEYNLVESSVSPGDTLHFEVESGQRWVDSLAKCDENGVIDESFIFDTISIVFSRMRGAPMFGLVACICEDRQDPSDDCLVNIGSNVKYVMGGDSNKTYSVYLFSNVAPVFFGNDVGAICVRVTLTRKK